MGDVDLWQIATGSNLGYPVSTKSEFVAHLSRSPCVTFRGVEYDTTFAAKLIPAFFFPLESADDLVQKASELLAARGLDASGKSATRVADQPVQHAVPEWSTSDAVVTHIEAVVANASAGSEASRARVEALDVVTHALEFVGHPRALSLWREARAGRLHPETRASISSMLEHVREAVDRGEWGAVLDICDCLIDLIKPQADRAHVGGWHNGEINSSTSPPAVPSNNPTSEVMMTEDSFEEFTPNDLKYINLAMRAFPSVAHGFRAIVTVTGRLSFPVEGPEALAEAISGAGLRYGDSKFPIEDLPAFMPEYYFPIDSEEDFVSKVADACGRLREPDGPNIPALALKEATAKRREGEPPDISVDEIFGLTGARRGDASPSAGGLAKRDQARR